MTESGKEFAGRGETGSAGASRSYRQLGLWVIVTLACCGVLGSVWRASADENRSQAVAGVKALDGARDSAERSEAIRDLVRSPVIEVAVVIPPLIRSLGDPAVEVRVEAVRALGPATSMALLSGSDPKRALAAIEALKRSLDDAETSVRIAAVYSLGLVAASKNPAGTMNPQSLVGSLSAMLDDPDPTLRASTIAALGVAGPIASDQPPPALLRALHDESVFNRAACVRALARFPHGLDERAIVAIMGLLETERNDSPVREAYIEVLNQAGARRNKSPTTIESRHVSGTRSAHSAQQRLTRIR